MICTHYFGNFDLFERWQPFTLPLCIVRYENGLNHTLCIVHLHCIYNGFVKMNGIFSLLGPIWLDWPFSQSPLSSADQIGLLCQFQSYSWSLCNLNSSYATQNSLCKMCPIFRNACQINKCKTRVYKSINQHSLNTAWSHWEGTPGSIRRPCLQ